MSAIKDTTESGNTEKANVAVVDQRALSRGPSFDQSVSRLISLGMTEAEAKEALKGA